MRSTLRSWKILAAAWAIVLAAFAAGCQKSQQGPAEGEAVGDQQPAGEEAQPYAPSPDREGSGQASPAPRASAPKPVAPKPAQETVRKTVPAGTTIELSLETDLATDQTRSGERFEARVTEPVFVGSLQAIPAGSVVEGVVTDVKRAKKLTGGATMTLVFREIRLPSGYRAPLAATLTSEGARSGKKSAAIIGGSAAGGAVLGKVIGKDTKDAAIGSIIGGAIGAGIAAGRDKELRIPAGTALVVVTEEPLQVPVRVRAEG